MSRNITKGLEQENECLILLGRFKWLRIQELALFFWKHSPEKYRYQYAQNLIKKLISKDFVFTQSMPNHAGTAVLLKEKGAKFVRAQGISCHRAKVQDGVWLPPAKWKHELLGHGLCALLATGKFLTETELRKSKNESNTIVSKDIRVPDLILESKYGTLGIEIERSRKAGYKRDGMIENMVHNNKVGGGPSYSFDGMSPEKIAFAFNPLETEPTKSGGRKKIDHEKNILKGIYSLSHQGDLDVFMIHLKVKNYGVVEYEIFKNGDSVGNHEEPIFNGPKHWYKDRVQEALDKDAKRYEQELERLRNNK